MAAYSKPGILQRGKEATVYQTADTLTPTDATKIGPYSGLYVGVTGDVTVCMYNDDGTHLALFKAVPAGTILPIRFQGVQATGTTATNLIGLA